MIDENIVQALKDAGFEPHDGYWWERPSPVEHDFDVVVFASEEARSSGYAMVSLMVPNEDVPRYLSPGFTLEDVKERINTTLLETHLAIHTLDATQDVKDRLVAWVDEFAEALLKRFEGKEGGEKR